MELNEQNVVVEMAKGAVSEDFGKGFVIGGLTTFACGLVIKLVGKFVVKPIFDKRKAKKKKKDEDIGDKLDKLNEQFDEDEEDYELDE